MNPPTAISHALAMEPGKPGVARLCQELLSAMTGQAIVAEPPAPLMKLPGSDMIGNRHASRRERG